MNSSPKFGLRPWVWLRVAAIFLFSAAKSAACRRSARYARPSIAEPTNKTATTTDQLLEAAGRADHFSGTGCCSIVCLLEAENTHALASIIPTVYPLTVMRRRHLDSCPHATENAAAQRFPRRREKLRLVNSRHTETETLESHPSTAGDNSPCVQQRICRSLKGYHRESAMPPQVNGTSFFAIWRTMPVIR